MLSYEVRDRVAWVTLDRPEAMNAMDRGFWPELRQVLRTAEADPDVRTLVFSGRGACFSAGGDIESFAELSDAGERRAYIEEALSVFAAVESFPKPTIAAVHGHALGGGCELTLVCDIVIADASARFGLPEARVGLVPGLGVWRGLAQLNLHWMHYLVLTGMTIDVEEAKLAGLVNLVVPQGNHLVAARELSASIVVRAPLALTAAKRILGRRPKEGYDASVDAVVALQGTEDAAEGIAAFAERRDAHFRGR